MLSNTSCNAYPSYNNWKKNSDGSTIAPNNGGATGTEQDCVSMTTAGEWDDVDCTTSRSHKH